MSVAITVALCTFKRADVLPTTLDSLARSRDPGVPWEVLVVDNACEDAVRRVCDAFTDRLPVRYESEAGVGVARARNKAVQSARAPLVFFADDDVLFEPDWLANMHRATVEHSDCRFWGGRIEPLWQVDRPAWFDEGRCPLLGDSIVKYDTGHEPRPWDPDRDPPFYTCNLALRVDAVREAGMFDVSMGHVGASRGTGEDSFMIMSIASRGGRGWYAADAVVHHPVPPQRLTRRYARAFAWRQGMFSVRMLRRSDGPRTPRWYYRVALERTFAGAAGCLAGSLSLDPARAFAGQMETVFNTSKLWHALTGRDA